MNKAEYFTCKYCGEKVFKKYIDGQEVIMDNFWQTENGQLHTCALTSLKGIATKEKS